MFSWLKGKNKLEKELSTNVDDDGSNGNNNQENTNSIDYDNDDANFDNMSVNTNDTTSATALTMQSLHTPRSNVDLRSMQSAQSLQINEDSDRDSFNFDRDHEEIVNNQQHDEKIEQEYCEELNKEEKEIHQECFYSDNKNSNGIVHVKPENDDGNNRIVKSANEKKTWSNNEQHQYELQENEFARLQQHEEEYEYEPEIAQGPYEMHYPSYYKYEEEEQEQEQEQQQHELSLEYPSGSSDAEYDEMLLNLEFNALIDVEETNRLLIRCDEYDERNDLKQKHTTFINCEMNKVNNRTNVEVDVTTIDDNNNKNKTLDADTTNVQESKYIPLSMKSDAIHNQETQPVPLSKRSSSYRKKNNNNYTIKSTILDNNDVMDVNTCEPTCEDDNSTSSSSDNDNKNDYHLHHYSDDADVDDSKLNIMKSREKCFSNDEHSSSGNDDESSTKDEKHTLQTVFLNNDEQTHTLEQNNKEEREVEDDNEANELLQAEEKQLELQHKKEINTRKEKDNQDDAVNQNNVINQSEESYNMSNKHREFEEEDGDKSGSDDDDDDDDQTVDSVMELEHIRQFFWPINIAALPYNDRPRFLLNVNAVCEEKCGCHESEKNYRYGYFSQYNNNKDSKSKENDSYSYTQLEGESYDTYNELNKVEETGLSSTSFTSVYQWIVNKAESFLDYWQGGNDLNIIGGYSHSASVLPALRIQEEDQDEYSKELEMEEFYKKGNATLNMMDKKQYMLQNKQMVKNRSSRSSMNHTTPSQSYHSHHNKHANYDIKTHYKNEAVNKTRTQESKSSKSNSNNVLETSANQALCAHMTHFPSYGTSDVANELHHNNTERKKRKNSQSFLYDISRSHKSTWSTHDSHATDKVLLHSPITVRNLQLLWIATTTRQYLFSFLSFVYVSLLFAQGLLWIMLDTLPLSSSSSSSTSEFMHPTSNNYFYNNNNNNNKESMEGVMDNVPIVNIDISKGNKSNHVASNFIIFLFKYCQSNRVTVMEAVSFGVIGFTILLQFLTCGISAVHFTRMPHILLCVGACMAIASALLIKQSADREQGTFLITGAVLHGGGTGFGLIGCLICAITEMGLVAGMSVQLQIMLLAWFVSSAVIYTFAPIMYHYNYYNFNNINMDDVNSTMEKENVLRFPLYLACTSLLFAVALICLVRSKVIERGANAYKHHFRTEKLINAVKGVSVRFVFRGMACVLLTSMIALMASSCEVLLSWPLDFIASNPVIANTQLSSSSTVNTVFSSFQVEEHQPIVFAKDANGHLLYSSASSTLSSSSSSSHYSTLDVQLRHSASSCRLISLLFLSALLTWPFCLIPGKCFALTGQFIKVTVMVLLTATCWTIFTSHVWPITHIQNTEPFLPMLGQSDSNSLLLSSDASESKTASSSSSASVVELLSITPSPQAHIWLVASVICTGLCCTLLISGILQSLMRVGLTYTTSSNNKLNYKKKWYSTLQGNATSSVRSSRHSQRTQSYKNSNKSITQSRVSTNANSYASQIEPIDSYTTQLQITKAIDSEKKEKDLLIASSRVKNNHQFEHLNEQQQEEYYDNNNNNYDPYAEQVELCNDSYVLDGKAIEVNSIESIRSQMLRDLRDGPASTIALSVTLVIVLLFTCGVNNAVAALILRDAAHTQVHTQSELLHQLPQQGSTSTTNTKHTSALHSTFFSANPTVQGYVQLLLMIDLISWLAVGCVLGEMIYIYRIKLRKLYAQIVSFLSVVIDYLFCCCFAITEREQVNEYDV